MSTRTPGRTRDLQARFPLEANGLELLVVPGTDTNRNAGLPLPPTPLPARISARILLLRFVDPLGAPLTPADVQVEGATIRWMVIAPDLPTLSGIDSDLQPDEITWLQDLGTAIAAQPGLPSRWLVVHTDAPLPQHVSVRIAGTDGAVPAGFEPRLSSLEVDQDGSLTVTARTSWLNGISYVIVVDEHPRLSERLRQRVILIRFANAFGVTELRRMNITITGGVRIPDVPATWVWPLADIERVDDSTLTTDERNGLRAIATERTVRGDVGQWLVVLTEERGDFSPYTLRVSGHLAFDALLSTATVHFKIECATSLDCLAPDSDLAEAAVPPALDYLTRDFTGFRRLLLDRLAVLGAADPDQNPAGLWSVLVELIAARADQLAYAQDSVATEAYLHTARLRPSVRRHARLLDYQMHEGVNARAWVHVTAAPGVNVVEPLPAGALFLTRLLGADAVLSPSILNTSLPPETQVFYAILPLRRLTTAHNTIGVYTWGEDDLVLPRGTTRCTLHDPSGALQFAQGDVILFESVASAATGRPEDADPTLRHVVRLARDPVRTTDSLLGEDVLEVEWRADDALPFDLHVRQRGQPLAVARGNLLLVAHGLPVVEQDLRPFRWGSRGRLCARLAQTGLTWAGSRPDWDEEGWSASSAVTQRPEQALPEIILRDEDGAVWRPRRDLLASDRSAAEFWVEMHGDESAWIRFGDDTIGRSPADDATFVAEYRVGNGPGGNVGARAIAHALSTTLPASSVIALANPLPATGGTGPETLDRVRTAAPYAFRRQERAVTLADWTDVAARDDDVHRAVATLHWSGSWHTVRVHVDRKEGRPADRSFVDRMTASLDRYRLAGYDLEVVGPEYVPLDIVLTVCAAPDAWPEAVAGALQMAFGTGRLPDGTRAFFHPDNFTFGDSVYLSQIVARAMAIPGVQWVDARRETPRNRFRRWSSTAPDQLDSGVLEMGDLEIPLCDSNPSTPERGRILFHVEGGA